MQSEKPLYIGIFAAQPAEAARRVRALGLYSVLDVLKHEDPKVYLREDEKPDCTKTIFLKERRGQPAQVQRVEDDLKHFEDLFLSPPGNYHCTCLYLGTGDYKVDPKHQHIYNEWKYGLQIPITVDFVVYIPGYLMAGYIKRKSLGNVECANQFSHMTMLMRKDSQAKAVESNEILKALWEGEKGVFEGIGEGRRAIGLDIPYKKSKIMYVISNPFKVEGVTGSDLTNGLQ